MSEELNQSPEQPVVESQPTEQPAEQAPETPAVEATPQHNWEKRFRDTRADWQRKNSELERERATRVQLENQLAQSTQALQYYQQYQNQSSPAQQDILEMNPESRDRVLRDKMISTTAEIVPHLLANDPTYKAMQGQMARNRELADIVATHYEGNENDPELAAMIPKMRKVLDGYRKSFPGQEMSITAAYGIARELDGGTDRQSSGEVARTANGKSNAQTASPAKELAAMEKKFSQKPSVAPESLSASSKSARPANKYQKRIYDHNRSLERIEQAARESGYKGFEDLRDFRK